MFATHVSHNGTETVSKKKYFGAEKMMFTIKPLLLIWSDFGTAGSSKFALNHNFCKKNHAKFPKYKNMPYSL